MERGRNFSRQKRATAHNDVLPDPGFQLAVWSSGMILFNSHNSPMPVLMCLVWQCALSSVASPAHFAPWGRLDSGNKHMTVPTRKTFKAAQSFLGPLFIFQESVPGLAIEETFHCCENCFLNSSLSLSHARTSGLHKKTHKTFGRPNKSFPPPHPRHMLEPAWSHKKGYKTVGGLKGEVLFSKSDIARRGASTIGEFKRRGTGGKRYCNLPSISCMIFKAWISR